MQDKNKIENKFRKVRNMNMLKSLQLFLIAR